MVSACFNDCNVCIFLIDADTNTHTHAALRVQLYSSHKNTCIIYQTSQINCCHLDARENCKYLVIKLAEISEIQLSSIGQNSVS